MPPPAPVTRMTRLASGRLLDDWVAVERCRLGDGGSAMAILRVRSWVMTEVMKSGHKRRCCIAQNWLAPRLNTSTRLTGGTLSTGFGALLSAHRRGRRNRLQGVHRFRQRSRGATHGSRAKAPVRSQRQAQDPDRDLFSFRSCPIIRASRRLIAIIASAKSEDSSRGACADISFIPG